MIKVYKKLTEEQIKRNVIFSSSLSKWRTEETNAVIHEVFKINEEDFKAKPTFELKQAIQENEDTIKRLLDDKFFNTSPWKFNIIRRGL